MRRIVAYIIAFLLTFAVTMVKYFVPALSSHTPLLMYHLIVIATAAVLGTGPAIFSLILSAGVIDYLLMRPAYYPDLHWAGLLQMFIYLLDGLVIIWLVHSLRSAEARLAAKNKTLQDSNDRVARMLLRVLDAPFESKKTQRGPALKDSQRPD